MPYSQPVRLTILTATVGVTLISLLAVFLRRRKRKRGLRDQRQQYLASSIDRITSPSTSSVNHSPTHRSNGAIRMRSVLSPAPSQKSSISRKSAVRSESLRSNISTASIGNSTITCINTHDTSNLSAEQLCELGLDNLQQAIQMWEDAIDKLEDLDDIGQDVGLKELHSRLHHFLERAYRIKDSFEKDLFEQVSTTAAMDSAVCALQEMDREYEIQKRKSRSYTSLEGSSSDQDSFVSASEMADLSELDEYMHTKIYQSMAMYETALKELKMNGVPCRTLRTNMLKCSSDAEFLAKLHCVRQGFDAMFADETVKEWLLQSLTAVLSKLLEAGDRDPVEFQLALTELIEHVKKEESWESMEEELRGRGVKCMSFYDVVVDFILLDAFMDLENPPSSVTTVVQNRWLSNGFKETALATACWSVLKAKRRMLKFPMGFIGHFYGVSEHTSPVLAWGFLGPDSHLKDLCNFFKDQILGYICDVFSFDEVRYTNVQQMADDMLRLARERQSILSAHLGL